MLALTLKHPWAWAIARLGKDIENRTWRPGRHLRFGEYFAIHGGKVTDSRKAHAEEFRLAKSLCHRFGSPGRDIGDWGTVFTPGVVAVCAFVGTATESNSPWFEGPIGWILEDVFALPNPVPCKGAQGLWELPRDVFAQVQAQFLAEKGRSIP